MQSVTPNHDPAPSRLHYRYQRWMLTPGIRLVLRFGVPFVLVFAIASTWLSAPERREALQVFVADTRAAIWDRPEFKVRLMAIEGAGPSLAEDIREVVAIDFPVNSFALDIEAIHAIVSGLDPVKSATVRVRPGGILQVQITERQPALMWRTRNGLALLDDGGAHIDRAARRSDFPDLPLIAGEGADARVAEAMQLLAAARPLDNRLRGLVRIGERRWDIVLDRGQRIMLPSQQPVLALQRIIALDKARDLFERDLARVDMRLAGRPTLRMNQSAVEDWWRIRDLEAQDY